MKYIFSQVYTGFVRRINNAASIRNRSETTVPFTEKKLVLNQDILIKNIMQEYYDLFRKILISIDWIRIAKVILASIQIQ